MTTVLNTDPQRDDLGEGRYMETSVTLDEEGHLQVFTKSGTNAKATKFLGSVAVTLLDENNHQLWASKPRTYEVDANLLDKLYREDIGKEQIPQEVVNRVKRCQIVHKALDLIKPNTIIQLSLEVTPEFYTALQNLSEEANVSKGDLLGKALVLMQIALNAEKNGKKIGIVEKDQPVATEIVGLLE